MSDRKVPELGQGDLKSDADSRTRSWYSTLICRIELSRILILEIWSIDEALYHEIAIVTEAYL